MDKQSKVRQPEILSAFESLCLRPKHFSAYVEIHSKIKTNECTWGFLVRGKTKKYFVGWEEHDIQKYQIISSAEKSLALLHNDGNIQGHLVKLLRSRFRSVWGICVQEKR